MTNFQISCVKWYDEGLNYGDNNTADTQLESYELYLVAGSSKILVADSNSPTIGPVKLPVGNVENNYSLSLQVHGIDQIGTYTKYPLTVQVHEIFT